MKERVLQSKQIEGPVPCKNEPDGCMNEKEDQNARDSAEMNSYLTSDGSRAHASGTYLPTTPIEHCVDLVLHRHMTETKFPNSIAATVLPVQITLVGLRSTTRLCRMRLKMGLRRYHWVAGSPEEAVAALYSTLAGRLERWIGTVIRREECQSEAHCPKIEPERLSRNILRPLVLDCQFISEVLLSYTSHFYTEHPMRDSCCYSENCKFLLFQQIIHKHRQPRWSSSLTDRKMPSNISHTQNQLLLADPISSPMQNEVKMS